jgi:predicted permease
MNGWRGTVRERLRAVAGAAPAEEVVDEIAEHLAERFEEALAAGLDPATARRQTLAELNDLHALADAARARARRGRRPAPPPPVMERAHMWTDITGDFRFATRLLLRTRAFTVAVVLTMALGLGAATAIFTIVDAVLLAPLPYPAAERLVAIWETDRNSGTSREPGSLPDMLDLRQQLRRVDAVAGAIPDELSLTPGRGEPRRLACMYASADLLTMLGVRPVLGRVFTQAEHRSGRDDAVLISERLWAQAFNRDPGVIRRSVRLDDRPREVVGVVPDGSDTGVLQWLLAADYGRGFADRDARTRVDAWLPMPMDTRDLPRDTHPVLMIGRLAGRAPVAEASDELSAVMARLERAYQSNKARGAQLQPFTDVVFGRVRAGLWALLTAVALVLIVACANVANLLLVRGTARAREIAVRAALGAAWHRLLRQFVIENGMLSAFGGALGIAVAVVMVRLLVAFAPPDVPRLDTVLVGARVLAAAMGLTALVAVAFGLVPVLQAWRIDLNRALAGTGSRSLTPDGGLRRARSGLVVAEIALAVVVTVSAGLMVRTVLRLRAVDPGFDVARVVKAEFQLPASRYPRSFKVWPDFREMHRFNAALVQEMRSRTSSAGGVQAVALAGNHPLDAGFTNSFQIVGREAESRDWPEIAVRRVTPGYFGTLRVALVSGRLFRDGDDTVAPAVALVNEAAAARFFGTRDPIGQQIRFWGAARQIVGIVGNERFHGIAAPAAPAVYTPLAQTPSANGAEVLLVRASDPQTAVGVLRAAIHGVDPQLAVFGEEPLALTLADTLGQQRFLMMLLGALSAAALSLAALGIYAALSYDAAERRREMGIRLALGALPASVGRLIVRRGALLAGAGLSTGVLASLALTRLIRGLLFEVAPGDVVTLAAATVTLAIVALTAACVPALRTARLDPVTVLRDE